MEEEKTNNASQESSKKKKRMIITADDIAILETINRFGFMTIREIVKITGRHEKAIYKRLKFLRDNETLRHKQIFAEQPGAYWLTHKGQTLAKSLLTPIKEPRITSYAHELSVIAVYLELKERYGEKFSWITARELMSDKIAASKNYKEAFKLLKSKIPDGIAVMGEKKFAVEVELALKGKNRLSQIITNYTRALNNKLFDAVLYYTDQPRVASRLNETIGNVAGLATARFRVGELKK